MFTNPLTPEDEYWVGYFRADGSIYRVKGLYLSSMFGQVEKHPVQEFANYIGKGDRVKTYSRQTNFGPCTVYTVSSSAVARLMYGLGAKSPDGLRPGLYTSKHFWRGLLDGDGSVKIESYGFKPQIEWNGTHHDLSKLQVFLSSVLGCDPPAIVDHSSIHRLCLSSNKAKRLAHLMYAGEYSANLKKLARIRVILDGPWATHSSSWRPQND